MSRDTIGDRIRNMTRDAIKSADPTYKGLASAGGAIAYALLEVANAINAVNGRTYELTRADWLAKLVLEDQDESSHQVIDAANAYMYSRESTVDQLFADHR